MRTQPKTVAAFSLVEVTFALGIASFSIIPIFGLLPLGLRSVSDANEQAAASSAVTAIARCIRSATSANQTDFSSDFGATKGAITYQLGAKVATVENAAFLQLGRDGLPSTKDSRMSARVEIVPPVDANTPGVAQVTVAWPNSASWNAGTGKWNGALGQVTTGFLFLPK
jgi:type II secretory pathway pseudopilin PulG